jgi:hypothetical protein
MRDIGGRMQMNAASMEFFREHKPAVTLMRSWRNRASE